MEKTVGLGIGSLRSSKKFDLILDRFLGLLETRFKSGFRYLPYVPDHPDWKLIHSLLFRNQPLTLNGDCYFPIFVEGDLVGAIQHSGEQLHQLDQSKILELVDMILAETLGSLYKNDEIFKVEANMQSSTAPSGVVKISDFRKYKSPQHASLFETDDFSRNFSFSQVKKTPHNIATLIEASSIDDAFKAALEIHEQGSRFALIHFWDLPRKVREDGQALKDLGPMSIFLPEILKLNTAEQEAIKLQFRLAADENIKPEDRPLWLSATMIPYADLLRRRKFDQQLLKYLSMSFLRIQKSVENVLGGEPQSELH